MEEGSEVSEGSEDAEVSDVSEVSDLPDASDASEASAISESDPESDSDTESESELDSDSDSDEWDHSEGAAGWFADPDVEGQERYFDGSDWTPETRPADPDVPLDHLPEHTGELQRALAAATADIDDVEDRLGNLFDRAEQHGERGGRARKQVKAEAAERAAEGRALAESVDQHGEDAEEEWLVDEADGSFDDDDDALADLDEALATEEPEKLKKGLFRRHS